MEPLVEMVLASFLDHWGQHWYTLTPWPKAAILSPLKPGVVQGKGNNQCTPFQFDDIGSNAGRKTWENQIKREVKGAGIEWTVNEEVFTPLASFLFFTQNHVLYHLYYSLIYWCLEKTHHDQWYMNLIFSFFLIVRISPGSYMFLLQISAVSHGTLLRKAPGSCLPW